MGVSDGPNGPGCVLQKSRTATASEYSPNRSKNFLSLGRRDRRPRVVREMQDADAAVAQTPEQLRCDRHSFGTGDVLEHDVGIDQVENRSWVRDLSYVGQQLDVRQAQVVASVPGSPQHSVGDVDPNDRSAASCKRDDQAAHAAAEVQSRGGGKVLVDAPADDVEDHLDVRFAGCIEGVESRYGQLFALERVVGQDAPIRIVVADGLPVFVRIVDRHGERFLRRYAERKSRLHPCKPRSLARSLNSIVRCDRHSRARSGQMRASSSATSAHAASATIDA